MINLNDTTPAAPTGGVNVKWQTDASGNVSAYYSPRKSTVTGNGALTIDASTADVFLINLTGNVTSMTVNNPTDGQRLVLLFAQDATGRTVALPTNFKSGTFTVSTTANSHSCGNWVYNLSDTTWYLAGQSGM